MAACGMAFPNTRLSLIQRLAGGGDDAAWREFVNDYWGPVCRFAQNHGNLKHEDAEDVAADVFQAILKNRLLERWSQSPSAKLRTLICCCARNILCNQYRIESGRKRLVREHGGRLDRYASDFDDDRDALPDELDEFYAAWIDEILQTAVNRLFADYDQSGRGDHFRVLYGRVCEQLSMPEIAAMLEISLSSVEGYYRHARGRLQEELHELIRQQVVRYSAADDVDDELQVETAKAREHLQKRGGLEAAVRKVHETQRVAFRPSDIRP